MVELVIKVRFNPLWAVPSFIAGVLNLYVFTLPNMGPLAGVLAVSFLVLGGLLVSRPMMFVDAHGVQVKNLFGMTLKRYPIESLASLELRGSRLFVTSSGGEPQRVSGVLRWVAAQGDWIRLERAIAEARDAREDPESGGSEAGAR